MATILPRLAESLKQRKLDPLVSVSELFLNFVAAYNDIPVERRHTLFISLINTVGAEKFLFVLLILLLEKYPKEHNVVQFASGIANEQDCETQLSVNIACYNCFYGCNTEHSCRQSKSTLMS